MGTAAINAPAQELGLGGTAILVVRAEGPHGRGQYSPVGTRTGRTPDSNGALVAAISRVQTFVSRLVASEISCWRYVIHTTA